MADFIRFIVVIPGGTPPWMNIGVEKSPFIRAALLLIGTLWDGSDTL
jgi:hypothetical protein